MPEVSEKTTGTGNTAVPQHGDHDRVAMLSLKADGTPDQHNPEVIIDKESAKQAARQQFAEQAVSAVDVQSVDAGRALNASGVDKNAPQDPQIAKAVKEHDKVSSAAEKAADKAIDSLAG